MRIDFSHGNGQGNEQKSSPQASLKKLVSAFWVGLFIGMIAFEKKQVVRVCTALILIVIYGTVCKLDLIRTELKARL